MGTEISPALSKMFVEEMDANSANSEGVNSKIGANINKLIDSNSTRLSVQHIMDTPGTFTWTCPTSVTQIVVACYGGGAGGVTNILGGKGGGGGARVECLVKVTPSTVYQFIVGAGGSPDNDGSDSIAKINGGAILCSAGGGSSLTNIKAKGSINSPTLVNLLGAERGGRGGLFTGSEAGEDTSVADGGIFNSGGGGGGAGGLGDGGVATGGRGGGGGGYSTPAGGVPGQQTGAHGGVVLSYIYSSNDTTEAAPI